MGERQCMTYSGMRPTIPDSLERELDEKDDLGVSFFRKAGYTSKSGFVAQAVKEKIKREKEEIKREKSGSND